MAARWCRVSVLDLRLRIDKEPNYSVLVPSMNGWLSSNNRGKWATYHRLIAQWRNSASWACVSAKVRPMERVYVLAELRFRDARRRDPANWYPTVKACVDGMVDAGVIRDDRADFLVGPDMRLGPKSPNVGMGAIYLHMWRLE